MAVGSWDVFVSYGHEDAEWVRALAGNLQRVGFEVFLDEWELGGGDQVTGRLEEGIRGSASGVLVVSPNSLSRPWVREEYEALVRQAVEQPERRLIPVIYVDVELPVFMANRLWVDFRGVGTTGPAYEARLNELTRALRGRPAAEVAASVSQARQELSDIKEPVTAAEIAASLQRHHPGYGGGRFEKVVLSTDAGTRRSVNSWLEDVAELYDPEAVASSTHQVLDGKLVLAGLAELDPDLRTMLETDGFLTALRGEIDVVPRAVAGPSPAAGDSGAPARETVFDFSTDTPGLDDDVRASDDRLEIEDDVRTLCRLMLARSTKPPLAIGLFGDWGTGKSFFMRRMQSRVREMQHEVVTSLGRGGCRVRVHDTLDTLSSGDA